MRNYQNSLVKTFHLNNHSGFYSFSQVNPKPDNSVLLVAKWGQMRCIVDDFTGSHLKTGSIASYPLHTYRLVSFSS